MLCGIWNVNGKWTVRFLNELSANEVYGACQQPNTLWWDMDDVEWSSPNVDRKAVISLLDMIAKRVASDDAKAILVGDDVARREVKRAAIQAKEDELRQAAVKPTKYDQDVLNITKTMEAGA